MTEPSAKRPVATLHPPISKVEVIRQPGDANDSKTLLNTAAVIKLAKLGETPQARRLYRLYLAEFRALEDQSLTHERREQTALFAALSRFGVAVQAIEAGELE